MAQRKFPWVAIVALAFVVLALTLTTYGTVSESANIISSGSIATLSIVSTSSASSSGIGVYSDNACAVPMTTINWGSVSLGGTVTTTVYVKNTGGASLTLSMTTNNWNPTTANGPLTVTWDKQATVLTPGQSTAATITLTASSSITGITSFSVQISISGTG
jgi:hypothetical protein